MNLSREDADLFFKLMWRLQFYVSGQHNMLPSVASVSEYAALSMAQKLPIRDKLWENPGVIGAYVAQNPDNLAADDLDLVSKWKRLVAGTFQVFRFLKKHTIFIGDNSQVYGVLGLYDRLKDILGQPPPILVKAVLLPFKGRIIYDGALTGYRIAFGSGIRSDLNKVYMAAKQNDRIITTLEPELARPAQKAKQAKKDWQLEVDQVMAITETLKGRPAVQSAAFGLLRASAALAQAAVHNPDDLDALLNLERRVRTNLTRLQTTSNRSW